MAKLNLVDSMKIIQSCIDSDDVFTHGEKTIWGKIESVQDWQKTLLIHVGLDPTSFSELRIALENKLNIILPTSFDDAVKTLGDVLDYVQNKAYTLKEEEYNVGT